MAPVPFQSKANDKGENHYDLIVIGGGSGGLGSARRAAQYGAKVSRRPFLQHSYFPSTSWAARAVEGTETGTEICAEVATAAP